MPLLSDFPLFRLLSVSTKTTIMDLVVRGTVLVYRRPSRRARPFSLHVVVNQKALY